MQTSVAPSCALRMRAQHPMASASVGRASTSIGRVSPFTKLPSIAAPAGALRRRSAVLPVHAVLAGDGTQAGVDAKKEAELRKFRVVRAPPFPGQIAPHRRAPRLPTG